MDLERAVERNWTQEASEYSQSIREDLQTQKREIWTDLITRYAPNQRVLDILDIGTGPGFFPIILTKAGHRVTGVDCVEEMLREARKNADSEQVCPDFRLADGQDLPFEDESFDCIVNRNVTWTLIDAEKAYREWLRVLRPGGRILIFDANWNLRYHDEQRMKQWQEDERDYEKQFGKKAVPYSPEAEEYRRNMPMCKCLRPQWDFDTFLKIGVKELYCKTDIHNLVWDEERKIRYRSTPMFLLVVEKPSDHST